MSPSRIRQKVVVARVSMVRQMLAKIATLPLESLETFLVDDHKVAAGESYLRRALEALLDLGRHVLAKGFGIAAVEYKEIPRALQQQGILSTELGEVGLRMAGYRNRMVHFYDEISSEELHRILSEHLGEIERITRAIEDWLAQQPERIDTSL